MFQSILDLDVLTINRNISSHYFSYHFHRDITRKLALPAAKFMWALGSSVCHPLLSNGYSWDTNWYFQFSVWHDMYSIYCHRCALGQTTKSFQQGQPPWCGHFLWHSVCGTLNNPKQIIPLQWQYYFFRVNTMTTKSFIEYMFKEYSFLWNIINENNKYQERFKKSCIWFFTCEWQLLYRSSYACTTLQHNIG